MEKLHYHPLCERGSVQGNLDLTTGKLVRYIEVLFHRPGRRILFVIPRTSLYRGSLIRGSTVTNDLRTDVDNATKQ